MVDRPEPLLTCWNHWIAVATGDQAGVMALLGLSDPRPIGFAAAREVLDIDAHREPDDPMALARVVVTPELDGWTLVLGAWCDPVDRGDEVLASCRALGNRYGRAQAYYYGAQNDGSAWLVVEDGTVVRRYCATGGIGDYLLPLGRPLPLEIARRAELGLPPEWDERAETDDEDEDDWRGTAFELAPEIAAALGTSPFDLTPATPARGTAVLARTPLAPGRSESASAPADLGGIDQR